MPGSVQEVCYYLRVTYGHRKLWFDFSPWPKASDALLQSFRQQPVVVSNSGRLLAGYENGAWSYFLSQAQLRFDPVKDARSTPCGRVKLDKENLYTLRAAFGL
ncbi:hypothetical protein [Pantoea sp. Fr+CA_20]|uniref:hypothetical protein n=1 Tax=Pantoea sp. Fr+CA_20 TaxID=2929506 RepID=UPI002119B1CE|nr:hypothetical protein [Pantoea sp. Fr+CA_20]